MNKNPIIKSLTRQKGKVFVLFILLSLITFLFVNKTIEYLIVTRETDRAGSFFRSIGELDSFSDESSAHREEAKEIIYDSPLVGEVDQRRYTSGVMKDFYNPDIKMGSSDSNFYPDTQRGIHNLDVWFYGELLQVEELRKSGAESRIIQGHRYVFRAEEVLVGYPDRIGVRDTITLLYMLNFNLNQDTEKTIPILNQLEVGKNYLMHGWHDWAFTHVEIEEMQGFYSPFQIRPLNDEGLWFIEVNKGEILDLSLPEYAKIQRAIEVQKQNLHAMLLVGTSDMSALPKVQDTARDTFLLEGRWLNRQDDIDGRNVIVISPELAQIRELGLGDTISFTQRGLQNPYYGYIQAGIDFDSWKTYPTHEVSYEIVGIYSDEWRQISSLINSDSLVLYVPNSTIPPSVAYPVTINPFRIDENDFSFVLKSSQDQSAFIAQYQPTFADLGFELQFSEDTGKQFWAGVMPVRQSIANSVIIFLAVLIIAILIIDYLFLQQNQKNISILRVLGVPVSRITLQLVIALGIIAFLGVSIGGLAAWRFAENKAAQTLSSLPNPAGVMPSTSISVTIVAGICLAIFTFVILSAIIWISRITKKPVLESIQDQAVKAGAKKYEPVVQSTVNISNEEAIPDDQKFIELDKASSKSGSSAVSTQPITKSGILTYMKFILRQTSRSVLRLILLIGISLGFLAALGWLQIAIAKNTAEIERLSASTEVQADIVSTTSSGVMYQTSGTGGSDRIGPIPRELVNEVLTYKNIKSAYFETTQMINGLTISTREGPTFHEVDFALMGINDLEKAMDGMLKGATITFVSRVDAEIFKQVWEIGTNRDITLPIVVPEEILNDYNLRLNDEIALADREGNAEFYRIVGSYLGGSLWVNLYPPALVPLSAQDVLLPKPLNYDTAKFTLDPAMNSEMPSFKAAMEELITRPGISARPLRFNFWDDQLTAVVEPLEKNINLLRVLYPIALALSTLIMLGLCYLLVQQRAREAALLRMLGVAPSKTRVMLWVEHLLLTFIGVLLGFALLGVFVPEFVNISSQQILLASGLYLIGASLGSLLGAYTVTNKKPMELLQVKE